MCTLFKGFLFFNLQELLQSSEREKEMYRQQLTRKEAELTRAMETIRREQQQIQEMRQQVSSDCIVTCSVCGCVCCVGENEKEREIGRERKMSANCRRLLSISPTCSFPGVRAGLA